MWKAYKAKWDDYVENHPTFEKLVGFAKLWLPPLNYITIHYAYFIIVIGLSSLIFWGSGNPRGSVSYVDSLFLVTSSMTNTGLNTRNLSEVTTWQQVQLWALLIIGSPIWVSFWTVLARKHAFEKRFDAIVARERAKRKNSGRLRRAPNIRNILSFNKHNTDPTAPGRNLPGLGSRAPVRPGPMIDELTELPPSSYSHRTLSAPGPVPTLAAIGKFEPESEKQNDSQLPMRDHISFADTDVPSHMDRSSAYQHGNHFTDQGRSSDANSDATSVASSESEDIIDHFKKILNKNNVTRSGQFYDLSSDEREHLGGCEYRALKVLALTVPVYGFLWQFLGSVALASYIARRTPEIAEKYSQNPWWTGIFYSVSAFNNGGMTLVDDSVIPFQGDYFVLIVIGLLILAGNTAYPVFLRLTLWTCWKVLDLTTSKEVADPWKETLEFILKYPRRVYTTLFPKRATWWLVAVLFVTNIIDWLAFIILNIGNPATDALPPGDRVMDGLFQAISVRAAGFVVFPIPSLYIGLQVLYLIMMYIAVYPVVITMRSSNVYEERSLGIYDDDPSVTAPGPEATSFPIDQEKGPRFAIRRRQTAATVGKQIKRVATFHGVGVAAPKGEDGTSRISYIGQQLRGQLAHDLWWLVLAVLFIVIIETSHFLGDPLTFSVFNILFEATSAYACVGLSIGLPNDSFSFAGACHPGTKLLLSLVMLRGRHRGLPVAIDRAVRLPGDQLIKEEEEDSRIRRTKTMLRMASRDG